jgi:hypothetical protein
VASFWKTRTTILIRLGTFSGMRSFEKTLIPCDNGEYSPCATPDDTDGGIVDAMSFGVGREGEQLPMVYENQFAARRQAIIINL